MFESLEMIQGGEQAEMPGSGTARIKVFGVGGGGGNAVDNMVEEGLEHVDYVVANTDGQALQRSSATTKLQIGGEITRGLGAGANPEVGYRAAVDSQAAIARAIGEAEMVFVTAGMGGGTGTGAAPVIARVAREQGALTVGVVTRPFTFEGRARARRAEQGLKELAEAVDTIIVIPNDRLLELSDDNTSLKDGFKLADTVLMNAVRGISDIIVTPGLVNVDFADVVHIMQAKGLALMGTGVASGQNRAREAALKAINSPLLEDVRIEGATGLLVNITGGPTTSLREINEALSMVQESVHEDTDTIFGAVIDERMGDELKITVVATGFSRVESDYDEDLRKVRTRFSTGETQQVQAPAVEPPSLNDNLIEDPVLVPVYAGESTVFASADTPMRTPAVAEMSLHGGADDLPPPVPGVEAPLGGSRDRNQRVRDSLVDLDEPAYLRRMAHADGIKRQPVVKNPFTSSVGAEDLDTPAYLRK